MAAPGCGCDQAGAEQAWRVPTSGLLSVTVTWNIDNRESQAQLGFWCDCDVASVAVMCGVTSASVAQLSLAISRHLHLVQLCYPLTTLHHTTAFSDAIITGFNWKIPTMKTFILNC